MKLADRDLTELTARDTAAAVKAGKVSAREVCDATLARIERLNPRINAIVDCDQAAARAEADAIDRRIAAGEVLPLGGVPFSVKDSLWVRGRRATYGSKLFADFIAPRDAWCVQRLRALGAVVVGITNCSEFTWKLMTNNLVYGITRNPWDTRMTTGGSSGGAASATAARFGPLALGTDAGGSVRRPAAHAGVVGMKPSVGLVPQPWGFPDPNFGISVVGQFARDVEDAALMLDALVGYEPADPTSLPIGGQLRLLRTVKKAPPMSLRIAWSPHLGRDFAVDTEVMAVCKSIVDKLGREGYSVEEADPQWPAGLEQAPQLPIQQSGLAHLFGKELATRRADLDPDSVQQIELGLKRTGVEVANALATRELIHAAHAQFFERFDVLLCPTTPITTWPVDQPYPTEIAGKPALPRGHAVFTPLFNIAGAPACSVPAGLVGGLPVGIQVVGARNDDARVLQFARLIELLVDTRFAPPFD
jgi:aspartyl-tRNA(Asn)/glutamyl-tRNA(Gln) amidotransferase subunit A